MIRRIKLAAVVTAVAAVFVVTAGGAGAGSEAVSKSTARSAASTAAAGRAALLRLADFSTIAGAKAYFRSIGVNPKGVVIQRSARNYAGPRCPGAGWACTRANHPVVQIAAAGGRNVFVCRTARCAVVQLTARRAGTGGRSLAASSVRSLAASAPRKNRAVCIKTMGLTQSCSISQSSATADNTAVVYENAGKFSGLTQSASYSASITQRATGSFNTNTACVFQATSIDGSTTATRGTPVTVTLESHQSVTITQDSKGSAPDPELHGGNFAQHSASLSGTTASCDTAAQLTQTQTLTSTATGSGPITQNENASDNGPNVSLDIEQNQGAGFFGVAHGPNNAAFNQTNSLTAIANTPAGPVNQTQSSSTGGIQAMVNQDSRDVSTANAAQHETQCEDAFAPPTTPTACDTNNQDPPSYSLTQTQFGPIGNTGGATPETGQRTPMKVTKGPCPPNCASQTGNDDDTFTITQTTQQDNDTGENQTNTVQGDCTTDGSCTVFQSATVNGEETTNMQSGQDVNTQTTCTGSDCTTSGPTTSGTLTLSPTGFSVSNTDVAEFGTGGMRGGGTGTINVSGLTGSVLHALLFWHGPTNSGDPTANASVTFAGAPITGTNIGVDSDNNWGFQNSQAYRADVTGLVTGNGSYSLSGFRKPGPPVIDINGVSLVVFYDDGNSSNDRNVVAWNGNDSNVFAGDGAWNETIPGVPYPGSGSASLELVVGDGQSYNDGEVKVNGTTIAGPGAVFQGLVGPNYSGNPAGVTGSLWDMNSYGITTLLTEGSNDLHITSPANQDALSLVVAMADVPAAGPTILAAPKAAAATAPTTSTPTTTHSHNKRGAVK
jgi:hypothetical protein